MINGVHFLLYSTNPEADQDALRDILETRSVPAGPDRVIMALPPGEIATHEGTGTFTQTHADRPLIGAVLYLMCDDILATVDKLKARGIQCTAIDDTEFGLKTTVALPSGGEIGLYQPSHETAIDTKS